MIVNAGYRGKVGAAAPKFTYTGNYNVREDGVVELLTSGIITFLNPAVIDVFMVGGGSGGTSTPVSVYNSGFGGGAGGYTRTDKRVNVAANTGITVTIGAGGQAGVPNTHPSGSPGENTTFGNLTVNGGTATGGNPSQTYAGKNGGSGGGGGVESNSNLGAGGSDGSDGEQGSYAGGKGQGVTTREFGEPTGKLYAGGGGGGRYMASQTPIISAGGPGGGGSGAWYSGTGGVYQAAAAGVANTGGGGGGGAAKASSQIEGSFHTPGASGGSGIVCIRAAK